MGSLFFHILYVQSILSEFNKEQEAFIKSKNKNMEGALAPWVGYPDEDALKAEILSLSTVIGHKFTFVGRRKVSARKTSPLIFFRVLHTGSTKFRS